MRNSRRSITLLALLLVTMSSFGSAVEHADDHAFEPDQTGTPRFAAGHERPVSDEHVESATSLGDEACVACALRQSSSRQVAWIDSSPHGPVLSSVARPGYDRHYRRDELHSILGRAPPAA